MLCLLGPEYSRVLHALHLGFEGGHHQLLECACPYQGASLRQRVLSGHLVCLLAACGCQSVCESVEGFRTLASVDRSRPTSSSYRVKATLGGITCRVYHSDLLKSSVGRHLST